MERALTQLVAKPATDAEPARQQVVLANVCRATQNYETLIEAHLEFHDAAAKSSKNEKAQRPNLARIRLAKGGYQGINRQQQTG
jgi:DNA-binding FadR family transcriptional regulator